MMKNWKTVKLGDLVKISKGKKVEISENGKYRCIQIEDLRNDKYLKYTEGDNKSVFCNGNDILIAWDGANAGTIGFGIEGIIGSTIAKLTPVEDFYTPFIGRMLQAKQKILREKCTGATIPHISKNFLINITIPLPPFKEQKRIVEILDKADVLRRKNLEQVINYNELVGSIFLEMFGDPVINPYGWEKLDLKNVSAVVSGVTKGRKLDGKQLFSYPYMRVANVQDGYLDLKKIKTIDVLESDFIKYELKDGDILLTEGGDPDKLGRGAIWRNQVKGCIHQNHIFRVRVENEKVIPEYLNALIGSHYGKRYFLKRAKQTTGIASINSRQLKGFPVILPPLHLQLQFKQAIENIGLQKNKIEIALKESEDLFSTLVQKAFKGELK